MSESSDYSAFFCRDVSTAALFAEADWPIPLLWFDESQVERHE